MTRKVLFVIVPLILLSLLVAQLTSARMLRNTFEHDAYLSHGGRFVEVVAEIECTAGQRVMVDVILSQGSEEFAENAPNALGRGKGQAICTGEFQTVPIRVAVHGRERFVPGPAKASGLAITTSRGQQTDVRQWQPAAGLTIHEGADASDPLAQLWERLFPMGSR